MTKRILYVGNFISSSTRYPTAAEILTSNLRMEGMEIIQTSDKANKFLRFIAMVCSVFKYRNFDYVIIDTYSTLNFYYALVVSQISRLLGLKYIPILHGGSLPIRFKKNPYLTKLIFKNSYCNVSPSLYLHNILTNQSRYSCLVIPNSIPIDKYNFQLRNFLTPSLLYVRSLATMYNPFMAVRVLAEIHKLYPEAKLCMVGPDKNNNLEELKLLAKELGVSKNIDFMGFMEKDLWHKKSKGYDIFINTTNIDNTPVSIIEAMALGLLVVSTDAGGLPYLINHKVDGLLVSPNDVRGMSEKILNALAENEQDIQRRARQKVTQFDWSNVKKTWLEILS